MIEVLCPSREELIGHTWVQAATPRPIRDVWHAGNRDHLVQTWILEHLFSKDLKGLLEGREDSLGK